MSVEPIGPYLEPLRKTVRVPVPVPDAFLLFTARLGTWWPLRTHSISTDRARTCGVEPRVGGAVFEERDDGTRFSWGWVLRWEPPHRVVVAWHPGREPDTAQEVEVRFIEDGQGTRVELEHRGWQRSQSGAAAQRSGYDGGWNVVLAELTRAAG